MDTPAADAMLLRWRVGNARVQGDAELLRLVELLLVGAKTARQVADLRVLDRDEIYGLAAQAESMAGVLQAICDRSPKPADAN